MSKKGDKIAYRIAMNILMENIAREEYKMFFSSEQGKKLRLQIVLFITACACLVASTVVLAVSLCGAV